METLSSFSDFQSRWIFDFIKNFRQISPVLQTDLKQVYVSICYSSIAIAVGAYLQILWNIGGLLTIFATLGCMFWLLSAPPYEELKRGLLIMAFSLLYGASIGFAFNKLAIDCYLSMLVSICIGVSIAFACLSGAAMLARHKELFYLGGVLSSGVSIFFWLQFCSQIFGGAVALLQYKLYFGVLVLVAYIVVNSVETFEKAIGDLENCIEEREEEDEEEGVYRVFGNKNCSL